MVFPRLAFSRLFVTHRHPLRPLLACAALGLSPAVPAATVAYYDFDDSAGEFENQVEDVAIGVTATPWAIDVGDLLNYNGVVGRAVAGKSWNVVGNGFSFSLNVAEGFSLDLTGVSFSDQRSSKGPADWQLLVDGVEVAGGTTSLSLAPQDTGELGLVALQGPVAFRIAASGAQGSSGTWRIDDFTVSGEVAPLAAPLPAPALLLASACVGLLGLGGRRRGTGQAAHPGAG